MENTEKTITGIGVSEGIAFGNAWLYQQAMPEIPHQKEKIIEEAEAYRMEEAVAESSRQLSAIAERLAEKNPAEAGIFLAQEELLQDPEMQEAAGELIQSGKCAEEAVYEAFTMFAEILAAVDDKLIAMRSKDLCDIRNRVIRNLMELPQPDLSLLPAGTILVAEDLLPSDTAMIDRRNVVGIITEKGNPTSHTAILARSFGIPAVLGAGGAAGSIRSGRPVVIDGSTGICICDPCDETAAQMQAKKAAFEERRRIEETYLPKAAVTLDGTAIAAGINIGGGAEDFEFCDFCGLYRTEFLFLEQQSLPDEEKQFREYRKVLETSGGKPVTLRTLDIGGDKQLPYLDMKKEDNPFLGVRAIRFCMVKKDLFRTQLRAALRASVYGDLRIMFPMIGSLEDFRSAKAFTNAVMEELREEQIPFREEIPLGIMIEIPSITEMSSEAAREADFASVGTNDLCQYLCAADRMNADVASCYQTFSPAMLRCLARIAEGFGKAGKELSVCGEMASTRNGIPLLLGLGYRKLSMSPKNLAMAKSIICRLDLSEAETLAEKALACLTQEEVLNLFE